MSTILIHDGVKEDFPEMEQSPFKRQDADSGKKQIWGACEWDHDMTSIEIYYYTLFFICAVCQTVTMYCTIHSS